MNIPRFTAEASLYKRSECYYQEAGDVVASRNGVLPAAKMSHHAVQRYCTRIGGIYLHETDYTNTYGCMSNNGRHGVWCGGDGEYENTCDKW